MFPLTSNQRPIWFEQKLFPDSALYNVSVYTRINGNIDITLFEKAINIMIAQSDAFRTTFYESEGIPMQKFHPYDPAHPYQLPLLDFSTHQDPEQAAMDWQLKQAATSIAVHATQLYYFALLKITGSTYFWYYKSHHLITDGWGMSLTISRTAAIYSALVKGETVSTDTVLPFANFVQHDQRYLESPAYDKDAAYWQDRFTAMSPAITVGAKDGKKNEQPLSTRKSIFLAKSFYQQIQAFAAERGCTTFYTFMGVLYTYFARTNQLEDLVLGIPVLNRSSTAFKKTLGLFVGVLPFRMNFALSLSFNELMAHIKTAFKKDIEHQQFPVDEIVRILKSNKHDLDALYTISLSFEKQDFSVPFDGIPTQTIALPHQAEQSPLAVFVRECQTDDDVKVDFDFNQGHWEEYYMEQFLAQFRQLFETVIAQPDTPLSQLPLITATEAAEWLTPTPVTPIPFDTMIAAFEHAVIQYPQQPALLFGNHSYSYKELNEQANALAHHLRNTWQIQRNEVVAVLLPKSDDAIIAILGILKAGAAYLPVDPAYPEERQQYMLEDASARVLLTLSDRTLPAFSGAVLYMDERTYSHSPVHNPTPVNTADDTCYIIYTSGSTGQPKGTVIRHLGVINIINSFKQEMDIRQTDSMLQFGSLSFDVSVFEIFTALFNGLTLYPVSKDIIADFDLFCEFIQTHHISIAALPPSYIRNLNKTGLSKLRILLTAGEPAIPRAELQLRPDQLYYNGYGPTECTVCVTIFNETAEINRNVPIGKTIYNTKAYVLDRQLQLMPCGIPGELYIAGIGLAKGYLNKPTLTAEKFIDSPFVPGEKLYRTGDVVRWLSDGNIEYLGRQDDQVKIRGHRIETGEIEVALKLHPAVQNVSVIVKESSPQEKALYAFVVMNNDTDTARLYDFLAESLPYFMIPDLILPVPQIPLTVNGKVDKRALLAQVQLASKRAYIAPATPSEQLIASIWSTLLDIPAVSATDNFFQLGGHSLKVGQFINRIHKETGIKLVFSEVFRAPVLKEVARLLDIDQTLHIPALVKIPDRDLYPLSPSQQGIWLNAHLAGRETLYNVPLTFVLQHPVQSTVLQQAFEALVHRHESLRTTFTTIGGLPYQQVKAHLPVQMERYTPTQNSSLQEQLAALYRSHIQTHFDLSDGPLFRIALVPLNEQQTLIMFTLHHIITDGLSVQQLFDELAADYASLLENQPILGLPLFQYRDYSHWLEQVIHSQEGERQLHYWQQKLQHTSPFSLAHLIGRSNAGKQEGAIHIFRFPAVIKEGVEKLATHSGSTAFIVLQALLKVLFFKLTGQRDITVGAAVSGRAIAETEGITGMLINTIALYDQVHERDSFETFLEQVKQTSLEGLEHQLLPYDKVLELVQPETNALFDVMIATDDQQLQSNSKLFLTHTPETESLRALYNAAKLNATFDFDTRGEGIELQVIYDASLFDHQYILLLGKYFSNLAQQVFAQPSMPISQFQLSDGQEPELFRYLGIDNKDYTTVYPLSTSQRDIYLTSLLQPADNGLRLLAYFDIPCSVDPPTWKQAITIVTQQEDSLRSVLITRNAEAYQAVKWTADSWFEYVDLQHLPYSRDTFHAYISDYCNDPQTLDLPFYKHYLFRISDSHYITAINAHHVFTDGASFRLLTERIDAVYHQLLTGTVTDDHTSQPYRDYVFRHLSRFDTALTDSFWQQRLAAVQPLHYEGAISTADRSHADVLLLEATEADAIRRYCHTHHINAPLFFRTIYALLVKYYCNADHDYCIREHLAGRDRQYQQMIGNLSHCFPLLITPAALQPDTTFQALCTYLMQQRTSAGELRYISLSLQNRIIGDEPLSFFFNYQYFNLPATQSGIGQLQQVYRLMDNQIELRVAEIQEKYELRLDYNERIFNGHEFLQRVKHVCQQLLQGVEHLQQLNYLLPAETTLLHNIGDRTSLAATTDILSIFRQQVANHPAKTAVVYKDQALSYATLDQHANAVAAHLESLGLQTGDIVGIMVERSAWMIVTLLGVLKAGGAYLPVDPEYPQERIDYLLQDSQASLLLTHQKWQERVPASITAIAIEDIPLQPIKTVNHLVTPGQLAYVIYTSGTTGRPKGAMITHGAVSNIAQAWKQAYRLDSFEVSLLQMASFSFDVFTGDVIRTFVSGGQMVICPSSVRLEIASLYALLAKHRVNIFESTPALIIPLMDHVYEQQLDISFLKLLILGSDSCPVAHFKRLTERFTPGMRVINSYGVTEACIDSGYYEAPAALLPNAGNTPIGQPLNNYIYYVCNHQHQLVPVGIPGELYIGGPGVASGYLGREALTAEKFIPLGRDGQRVYRTGDIVRWLPDGNLEFAGRKDDQVKVRGFRIELQEIESVLLTQTGIKEALVTVYGKDSEQALVAWYVTSDASISAATLREGLKHSLPDHMIPAYFIPLERLPLTPNGKVDRKALPDPLRYMDQQTVITNAPVTGTEQTLLTIWQDVLRRHRIGITDNFFELGGHSLKATNAVARIYKTFQVNLPLNIFFSQPTIAAQAAYIDLQSRETVTTITPVDSRPYYPLSSSQKRLYLLHQIEGSENSYNMPAAFLIKGQIDRSLLEACFRQLITRHEILRTAFEMKDGEPVQVVKSNVPFHIGHTVSDHTATALIADFIRLFDLASPPLLRAHLYTLADQQQLLLIDMHHIISDAVSAELLITELTQLYQQQPLPAISLQYKDFAVWQQQFLQTDIIREQERYWLDQFADEPPVLNLQTDFPRPAHKSFNGKRHTVQLPAEVTQQLHSFCQSYSCTIHQLLLTVFKVLLYRYSGNTDLVVGVPVAGRTVAGLEQIMGIFINTLALRSHPDGELRVTDFLTTVKQSSLSALKHQDYPFERLIEQLDVKRDMSRNPLFDIMFTFLHEEQSTLQLGEAVLTPVNNIYDISKFDLLLSGVKAGDDITLSLEYSTDLFREETALRMMTHYLQLLTDAMARPEAKLSSLQLLTPEEKNELLTMLSDTQVHYPANTSIYELFLKQVQQFPNNIALHWEGQDISYAVLEQMAGQVANAIRHALPGAVNPIIAVLIDRRPEMVIALLGILKAGGAYLPIDPDYPAERIRYMLDDSQAAVLVTHSSITPVAGYQGHTVYTDQLQDVIPLSTAVAVQPDDLAYIIYTSGSTGMPKGVMVTHRNVVRLLFTDRPLFDFNPQDTWTLFHSYCFDFSVWEMYGALLFGGKLVIVPKATAQSPRAFLQLLKDQQVSILNQTPGSFYNVISEVLESSHQGLSLRYVIFGGEALKPGKLQAWHTLLPDCKLINMYGITETTVHVTYKAITQKEITDNASNIGQPIPTLSLLVLDRDRQLVPVGVAGELCVGGAGLARGYLNREELTAERFTDHPYVAGERLYRTGDLAKLLPNGDFEYLGRIDHQVKIRGFRIELGEIESKLLLHPAVKDTLVIDRDDHSSTKYLCAYIVTPAAVAREELRKHLSAFLPDYMIPSFFILLPAFPLTGNGKIDRKRLPLPEDTQLSTAVYEAPVTGTEQRLATLWKQLLSTQEAGLNDHFFELGGHSLKAAQLAALIHKEFQVEVSIKNIFSTPVLRDLALLVDQSAHSQHHAIEKAPLMNSYPASSAEKRLYILNQIDNSGISYNIPAVYAIEGNLDLKRLQQTIRTIVDRHEILRSSFVIEQREVVQRIHDTVDLEVEILNCDDEHLTDFIKGFVRPFDLSQAPLLRTCLVRTPSGQYYFLFDIHHIIADGVSVDNFIRELSAIYGGTTLSPLRIQSKDFAYWQQQWLKSPAAATQKTYWLTQFDGEERQLNMPTDYVRPPVKSYEGALFHFTIPSATTAALQAFSRTHGVTPFMVLLGTYAILLSRYSGQEDIIVGTPVAGRSHADMQELMGMYVNTLPLKQAPNGNKTFREYVQEVKEGALKAFEHQDYPFEALLDDLEIKRDISRNPLFDYMFSYRADNINTIQLSDLLLKYVTFEQHNSKMDISLEISAEEDGVMAGIIEYATRLFSKQTIRRLAGHFIHLLEQVLRQPDHQIAALTLVTERERQQLLQQFNAPIDPEADKKALHIYELFRQQVYRYPDHIAVETGTDKLSYHELDQRAGQLATLLLKQGSSTGKIVGILTDRNLDLLIGIFAILKAGATYLPIDPEYPADRIKYMLEDSHAEVLLTQSHHTGLFPKEIPHILLDQVTLPATEEVLFEQVDYHPLHIAYVIYTSGSTGTPKGVPIAHHSLHNFLNYAHRSYKNEFSAADVGLCISSVSFDASVMEIFIPLSIGAKLILLRREEVYDIQGLANTIAGKKVTFAYIPPSLLQPLYDALKNSGPLAFNKLDVGAEVIKDNLLRLYTSLSDQLEAINSYGPTEGTIVSTTYTYDPSRPAGSTVPIGKPLPNIQVYIVNEQLQLQPIGVPGELCISGVGLTPGYMNNPALTAEKFVDNPFLPGHKLYRSGDLAKWMPDGNIDFIGRKDQQVKIRGFRIELGEIENKLLTHPDITQTLVIDREDLQGNKFLCAYIISTRTLDTAEIKAHLAKDLPVYMLPAYFVTMDKFPLTKNGKVDRKALPAPAINEDSKSQNMVAPADATEKQLHDIWKTVLATEQLSVEANFFESGGNSLKIINMLRLIQQSFGDALKVSDLFDKPTIREQAAAISKHSTNNIPETPKKVKRVQF
ncbi:non-ribosomal peptide synthetase [Chitinophaga pendula]|uniref:non-ribosomal peptide synthetase n=1 Tax=Chitinophaga TaxID=79328 RepID=UPI000BB04A49|nr:MULTISPECIES: non-ribosomal peptide synthetase [Chitinophaga]ASZ13464.1 hypothetical protein CK934_22140 [Chitinophaga sp. MD30]UCJ08908.1 non-ribosomal peptide synthetase [Chitinophaga pendula]